MSVQAGAVGCPRSGLGAEQEGRAKLHRIGTGAEQGPQVLAGHNAACGDKGPFAKGAKLGEQRCGAEPFVSF